ncbi:MAG: copper homeostasis protein CutC [Lachnospiraceae bacterium]|nr:copper homeostasis protein CutC [Lachnospiraceae bacterium]
MKKTILEVCVDSMESAIAAARGGADRLELCSNLIIGGTTPDIHLYECIRREIGIPVRALIRPRFGDFYYSAYEYEIMKGNITDFRKAGAEGVVIGCLDQNGALHRAQMEGLITCAAGMKVTLHRAFDVCKNPMETLREAEALGIDTILTSGQANNCMNGMTLLEQLLRECDENLTIMPGAGINSDNIGTIANGLHARAYHMSGKKVIQSEMQYRRENVPMGLPGFDEYEIWRTDEEEIRKARLQLDAIG